MSPRTGRPKSDNPRNKSLQLRLTQSELDMIQECANSLNENRTNVIMKGIALLLESIKKSN